MRCSGLAIGWVVLGGFCFMAAPFLSLFLYIGIALDVLLLACCVADVLLLRQASAVTAQRVHEDIFSLGAPNTVAITLENGTSLPLSVTLRDAVPASCESEGYSGRGALPPFGVLRHTYHLTPLARGIHHFGPLTLRLKSPLGLLITQRALLPDDTVKVYPNIRQTGQQLLADQSRLRQVGIRKMRLRGQGMEFESLRDYLPDDELRRVDWLASARRGNLVTREYDIERSQQIMLLLDLGRTMASHLDYMTKLDHALNASVLLTHVAGQAHDRVGIMAFADEVLTFMPPGKGGGQLPRVLEQLYPLQPRQVEANYRQAFAYLANRVRKRSLIILFTDLLDPDSSRRVMESLSLLHPQHLVLCVALSDYELREMLSGAPPDLTGLYQQAMATTVLEDRQLALGQLRQRGILTVDASPNDLSVAVVNAYLAIKHEGKV